LSIKDIIAEGICDTRNEKNEIIKRYFEKWRDLYISVYGEEKWKQNLWHFVYWWEEIEIK